MNKRTSRQAGNEALTRWQALAMRKIKKGDVPFLVLIVLLAAAAVWSGNRLVARLSPEAVIAASGMLDELQIPRTLPNAVLEKEDGTVVNLWDLLRRDRTVVTVYAPWCPPCQKELPELVEELGETGSLVIVVAPDEDHEKVRTQLENLGLQDTNYFTDVKGTVIREGRIKDLPTTFLVGKYGRVKERLVGFSSYQLHSMIEKAQINDTTQ